MSLSMRSACPIMQRIAGIKALDTLIKMVTLFGVTVLFISMEIRTICFCSTKEPGKGGEAMSTLFDLATVDPKKPADTCRSCVHRQRWQCGGSIIQYCAARKSNRTDNGLLKIKVTDPA